MKIIKIPNIKIQIRMTEIQNRKNDHEKSNKWSKCFGHWNFDIICNLSIVIWYFLTYPGKQIVSI